MKLFVYGTLKRGGALHHHIKKSKYIGVDKIFNYEMYNIGWFPAVKKTGSLLKESSDVGINYIYGEIYEVNESIIKMLDEIEGKGVLFDREKCQTQYGECWIYVMQEKQTHINPKEFPLIPYGFYEIKNKEWKIFIGDDKYKGDASKIVFDMRFFDTSAGRCSTNKQYMKLYKDRTADLDINTSVEPIFLTDLMLQCNLEEI